MSNLSPLMRDNCDIASFYSTKLSWKGKYRRVFSIGTDGITTSNPQTFQCTNQWAYKEIAGVLAKRDTGVANEFHLVVQKPGKKLDTLKFSCEHRAELLTAVLKFRSKFADQTAFTVKQFKAHKHHWSDNRIPVTLQVTPSTIDQLEVSTGRVLCSYDYQEIEGFAVVSDDNEAFVIYYGGFQRMHMFSCLARSELIESARKNAEQHIGVSLKCKEGVPYENFDTFRLGKFSDDDSLTSLVEFKVSKVSVRTMEPTRRLLCVSECAIIERDVPTYTVINLKPLSDVFAIVRDGNNPQLFTIEYVKCGMRQYLSTERDSLLATLLDSVRSSGNHFVSIEMSALDRGKRVTPLFSHAEDEVELALLKLLTSSTGKPFKVAVQRFNANVSYNGLSMSNPSDARDKLVQSALISLLEKDGDSSASSAAASDSSSSVSSVELHAQFGAIRRLVASKPGFNAFGLMTGVREKLGKKVVKALRRADSGVTHAAIEMLCALMQPMHDNYDLKQEQNNKSALMASDKFVDALLDLLAINLSRGSGALIISALLDFITYALCAPYSETTDGATFDKLLDKVSKLGRIIFKLFQHPSMSITKSAGMIMRALIEEGSEANAKHMQDLALAEGAFPKHLLTALFTDVNPGARGVDRKTLASRQLSRYLIGLWHCGNEEAHDLLKRMFPAGLLSFLSSDETPPSNEFELLLVRPDNLKLAQEQSSKPRRLLPGTVAGQEVERYFHHWKGKLEQGMQAVGVSGGGGAAGQKEENRPIVLRRRRQRVKASENWALFYYNFNQDHQMSNLIWNHKTREEVRETLENELRAFSTDIELSANENIAWNHREFQVRYLCLSEEIKIGDYFLRVLLDESEDKLFFQKPYDFFNDLYHRFLTSQRSDMRCICLQAMTIVYRKCHPAIGAFNDTQFIFQNLEKTNERAERDRLVQFVEALMHCEKNAKHLLDCNGVKVLVELLTLAHLHTSRATVPLQSNLIEASPEMGTGASSEKEWYYTVGGPDNKKQGPVSFEELKQLHAKGAFDSKTRFWAQGMEGWKSMRNISQLKWTLLATDQPVLNESELCVRVLNILNRICSLYSSRDASGAVIRPLPRIRRMLSEPSNLPHLVQLLLTFDPMIVEKTVLLVHNIMLDNPLVSRLFSTGLFFFILMYTGSNVLPVAELLYYSHLKQAFRSVDDSTSDIMRNSVLGSLLPHAMVYFLENHGPSQFATVFLGEYDTPEAIWSNVMRQHLILKIAQHIADFSPRLRSNNRAVYQYCALPAVHYPQLDGELFVNIFYLRNFCNTAKFPNWQVSDPVGLLRECLDNWKKEVAKKPSSFNEKEALEKLGLKPGVEYSESEIRRAYFKLAQKYHPDKNPDGREMFEEINTAYEFLYNRRANKHSDGPNPQHIDLLLKTQSILFNNYSHELQPYKYAGYPNLLATIQMEIEDNTLFGKALPLLPSATELCFHTVHCSALNAEELRRERGLVMLQSAMDKCISGITKQSSQEEMRVQVCRNVIMCFSVAAQFEQSRKELLEMPSVVKNLCRIMSFKHLPGVCVECCRCVGVFGRDSLLQSSLLESGVLWHLILFLFNYDYTLDEAHGINADTSTHETEVLNRVAKKSVSALRKLAGFGGRVKLPASHLRKKSSRALALSLSQTGSLINNNNISPSEDTNNNNTNGAGSLTNGVSSSEKEEEVMSGGTGGGEEGSGEDDLANGTNDNDAQEDDDLLESDKGVVYPENGTIRACLSALLTPYLYRCMLNKSDYEFLKLLNSNSENPYLIWDNGTRTELMEYVKRNQADILRTGECEASFGSDFVFSSHSEELVVGDIYVRVYNEQPQFPLEQPTLFARNLIAFLGSEAEYLQSLLSLENDSSSGDSKKEAQLSLTEERTKRVKNVSQALIALKNCIRNNQGVEKECMGHFKLLFSLLASFRSPKLQLEAKALQDKTFAAIQVISCVVCNKECVASIADAQVLGFLLVCFEQLSQQVDLVLDCVHQLASNRDIVKECKRRGAFIYILHEFCSSRDPSVRTKSAELFAKLMATNLHGAEVRIFLSQFLPPLFMDAMRDNAENSVHMFESVQENPELVWRDETRERVKKTVKKLRQQLLTEQMRDPNFVFQLPKDFAVEGIKAEGVVIEGVILSIYVSQPGWVVRRPVEFMTGLLVHFKQMCTAREPPSEAEVDLVVSATGVFFLGQKSLLPRVCETGCIPSIVQALVSPTIYISVAAVKLIHILSVDPLCVRDLSKAKCIEPLMVAMRKSSQCLVFACEALNKLFSNGDTYLVRQALDGELIEYLLSLLSKPLEAADNQKSVKAHIADALKAMAKDPHLGEEVSKLLDESSVWKEFKSQKHDLFLENSPPAGFLTGGAQVAGYLTQTASTNGVNMPPPIEPHHHPQD